jgi:hypothetical protein
MSLLTYTDRWYVVILGCGVVHETNVLNSHNLNMQIGDGSGFMKKGCRHVARHACCTLPRVWIDGFNVSRRRSTFLCRNGRFALNSDNMIKGSSVRGLGAFLLRLPAAGTLKRYSKALEYEYRVKTAALGTLKWYSILSLTLYLE